MIFKWRHLFNRNLLKFLRIHVFWVVKKCHRLFVWEVSSWPDLVIPRILLRYDCPFKLIWRYISGMVILIQPKFAYSLFTRMVYYGENNRCSYNLNSSLGLPRFFGNIRHRAYYVTECSYNLNSSLGLPRFFGNIRHRAYYVTEFCCRVTTQPASRDLLPVLFDSANDYHIEGNLKWRHRLKRSAYLANLIFTSRKILNDVIGWKDGHILRILFWLSPPFSIVGFSYISYGISGSCRGHSSWKPRFEWFSHWGKYQMMSSAQKIGTSCEFNFNYLTPILYCGILLYPVFIVIRDAEALSGGHVRDG